MASCRAAKREGSVVEAREEEGDGGAEMIAPSLKRFCSSVVRKIAVEGNIGEPASATLRAAAMDQECRSATLRDYDAWVVRVWDSYAGPDGR